MKPLFHRNTYPLSGNRQKAANIFLLMLCHYLWAKYPAFSANISLTILKLLAMNATHIHLLLTHFPIVGTLIASALMVWAIVKNNPKFKDFAATIIVVLAVSAVIVNVTGESAEDTVENIAGINKSAIEVHEEAAKPALILTLAAGLLCTVFLFFSLRKLPMRKSLFLACTVLTVLAFAAMARAGYYGGQIRHTEITGAQAIPADSGNQDED